MGSQLEIERKFLVDKDLFFETIQGIRPTEIVQGYLVSNERGTVRIRVYTYFDGMRDAYLMSKLSTGEYASNVERDDLIDVVHAEVLISNFANNIIKKRRYHYYGEDRFRWDIDVFISPNEGLILAEIELPSIDTPFIKPKFITEEVTGQNQYYNHNMH